MDFTSAAIGYLTKAFTENKDAQAFKNDFFGAFVSWVRPLFLKDDVAAAAVLTDEAIPAATKEKVIAAKLPALLTDDSFRTDLTAWVKKLQSAEREKNVISEAAVKMKGAIVIGDTNVSPGADAGITRKNIVEGGTFEGDSFRLGDDYAGS